MAATTLSDEELDKLIHPDPDKSLVNESADPNIAAPLSTLNDDQLDAAIHKDPVANNPSMVGDVIRGIDGMKAIGGGLTGLMGNLSGLKSVEDWGMEIHDRAEAQARMNPPTIGSLSNVKGPGDLLRYATESVLENLPMFIPSAITGGVGGLVARNAAEAFVKNMAASMTEEEVAKLVAKRVFIGTTAGALTSSDALQTGMIYGDNAASTGEGDPETALAFGAAAGAVDALPEGKLLANVLGPASKKVTGFLARKMGAEGAASFLRSAPAGVLQTFIDKAAMAQDDPKIDLSSDASLNEYINAGAKFGAVGGIIGAGTPLMHGILGAHPNDQVRVKQENMEKDADLQAGVPPMNAAATPADNRLSEIVQQQNLLDAEASDPNTTDERKAKIAQTKADLAAEEAVITKTGVVPGTPLVNENNAPTPPEGGKVVGFTTAKGSTYDIQPDGTTIRNKAARPEHPGDSGVKDPSEATFYLDPDQASALARPEGFTRMWVDDKGNLSMLWKNPQTGSLGSSESQKNITPSTEPAVGKIPLELWRKDNIGVEGGTAFKDSHFGNPITELKTEEPPGPAVGDKVTVAGQPGKVTGIPGDVMEGVPLAGDQHHVTLDDGTTKVVEGSQLTPLDESAAVTAPEVKVPETPAPDVEGVRKKMLDSKRLQLEEEKSYLQNSGEESGLPTHEKTSRIKEIDAALANDQALDAINSKPTYAFKEEPDMPEGVNRETVDAKREQVHGVIDSLVNENHGTPEEQARYKGAIKAAIEPHINFITGEDIKVKKSPRKANRGDAESFGVNATRNGGIEMWIPSHKDWDARNARETKKGGLLDTLATAPKTIEEEVIHAAHYAYLRDKWEAAGKKGAFDEYVNKRMTELGNWLTSSTRNLPERLGEVYTAGQRETNPFETGSEFMRAMIQRARTGELTEDAIVAANVVKRGGPTTFLRGLVKASQSLRDAIGRYLNPETSTKGVQDVYKGVNDLLDKYGNIQKDPVPASTREEPVMPTARARELGETPPAPPDDGENYRPQLSKEEQAARQQSSSEYSGQTAAQKRGLTPEVKAKYKEQLATARDHFDRKTDFKNSTMSDAAKTHAQMEMAKGNRLSTNDSVESARQAFENNLQRKVPKGLYKESVSEAREEPLHFQPARRSPEEDIANAEDYLKDDEEQPSEEIGHAVATRSPEIEEIEGGAHASLDKIFSPTRLVNERTRNIKQGSRLRFGDFTPMELSVLSQPKEPSFFPAKEFFDHNGSVLDNAEFLMRNPEVHGTPLVGSERTALYKITMMGLDHMRTEFWENPENFHAEEGDHISDLIEGLDKQYANFGTEVGRIGSSMTTLAPFIGGRKAFKDYAGAILQQWKRRFGRGEDVLDTIRARLNDISQKAVSGVITRPEMMGFFRKILGDLDTKEYRKAVRETLVNESQKMNGVAGRAASRAADLEFGNLESEPALKEAANRILNDMTFGLPRQENAGKEQAATVLSQALTEVTRNYARETGAIPSKEASAARATDSEKLATILKNPDLYDRFVSNLEERMHTKFGGENPSQNFHEAVGNFIEGMQQKKWMDGLLEKVVADKAKEMKMSITKATRDTFGQPAPKSEKIYALPADQAAAEIARLRDNVTAEMKAHGITNPDTLNAIAEDVHSMLNDSVEKAREVWAGQPGTIRKSLQEIGQTVNNVARQGYRNRQEITTQLAKSFIEKLGLPNTKDFPHAQRLQDIIAKSVGDMVENERQGIMDRILRNADPAVQEAMKKQNLRGGKTPIEKIIEMANVGALTNEKVYSAVADKLGLAQYNEADAQTIQDWGQRIGEMSEGRDKLTEVTKLRDFIESRKGITWKDMLVAGMYTSMLSGPSTHLVNAASNALNLMGKLYTESVLSLTPRRLGGYEDSSRIPAMFRALGLSLTRGGQLELRETLNSGIGSKLGHKVEGVNPLEFDDPIYNDKGAQFLGTLLAPKSPYMPKAKYVVRFLQGVDMMFYKAAQEVDFAARGYNGNGEAWAGMVTAARDEFLAQGKDVDSRDGNRQVQLRAMDMLEQSRIAGDPQAEWTWRESHGEALRTTFNDEPRGWIGDLSKMVSNYSAEHKIAKLLVPFTRIVANVLNAQIDWSPFGTLRWAFSKDFQLKDIDGHMQRDPRILVKSLTSMVALGGLATLLAKHSDDEDPWFTIYGSGPKDAGAKAQLYERGWKPNTIKIGNAYISYLPTPMSLSLASLGTLMDRYREGSSISPLNTIPQLGISFIQGTLNQSFLSGIADLFSAFESPNPEAGVQRILAKTLTLPIPNLVKQIDAWADPSVQSSSTFLESVIKQIPIARHMNGDMLNVFGKPVTRTPGPANIPFGSRFITMQNDEDPVYNLLGANQLTVPTYSKQTQLNKVQMTEDQYFQYVKQAGPRIYDAIRRQIPQIRNLSKDDQQDAINKISSDYKKQVRDAMSTGQPLPSR